MQNGGIMKIADFFSGESARILLVALLAACVLGIPHLLRDAYIGDALISGMPYYHARISEQILDSGIPQRDKLSFGGRAYIFNPYHLFLSPFISMFGARTASILIPFFLGIFSGCLFYFILKKQSEIFFERE